MLNATAISQIHRNAGGPTFLQKNNLKEWLKAHNTTSYLQPRLFFHKKSKLLFLSQKRLLIVPSIILYAPVPPVVCYRTSLIWEICTMIMLDLFVIPLLLS